MPFSRWVLGLIPITVLLPRSKTLKPKKPCHSTFPPPWHLFRIQADDVDLPPFG